MTRGTGFLTIALVILDIAILVTLSAYSFDTNDNMYAAAPFARGSLYRDVHFVQGPVTFYFLKGIASVVPEGFAYLALRLSSIGLLLAALFAGCFLCIDRGSSRCAFLLFAGTKSYFISAALEIGSYALPLLLLALAAAALWKIRERQIAVGVAAILVGLAASAKLNHVLFFVPLAVFVLLEKRKEESFLHWMREGLLPFVVGGLLGSLPVIVAVVQAPNAFLLHALIFHSEFSLRTLNLGSLATFKYATNMLIDWAATGGAAFTALGVYALFSCRATDAKSRHFLLFALLGIAAALVAALSPGITYKQYWAPVTFFAALAGARFLDRLRIRRGLFLLLGTLVLLPIVTVGVNTLRQTLSDDLNVTSGTPKVATVISINRKLKAYALRVSDTPQCDKRIFSLAGAFVVDSGFTLSRYMEGGPFWSWVSAQVPQAFIDDKSYHLDEYMIHPERWVRDQRINFLLLGFYPKQGEADMEKYASERGFSVVALPAWNGLTLKFHFNPDCIKS